MEVNITGNSIEVKGKAGENKRKFELGAIEIKKENNEIVLNCKKATKREKKVMNTIAAHIKNMIKGAQEKFEYKLKICFNHFPITIEIKENEAIIKNFLGEKVPRKARLPKGAEVKIDGQIITVTSVDKGLAGQVAANFEKATRIRAHDRRVFQDGIFMITKAGREI